MLQTKSIKICPKEESLASKRLILLQNLQVTLLFIFKQNQPFCFIYKIVQQNIFSGWQSATSQRISAVLHLSTLLQLLCPKYTEA